MSSDKKNINAILVIEILGKPPEHLKEALEGLISQIGNEPGVEVLSKNIAEPTELPKNSGMFTTYGEIEVEVKDPLTLSVLMFKYMPAHIDIISPENFIMTNKDYNEILNELTRRLHGYDHLARVIQSEKLILEKKLRELTPKEEKEKTPSKKISKKK